MDSMTEELARAIHERANNAAKIMEEAYDGKPSSDRLGYWCRIRSKAWAILQTIEDYREAHPEEYKDISLSLALQRENDLQKQVLQLRQELARYKELKAVQG